MKIPHDRAYHQPAGTSTANAARPQGAARTEGTGLLQRRRRALRCPQTSVRVPRLRHGCRVVGEYHRGYHSGRRAWWPVNGGGKRPGGALARVSCGRGLSERDLPWAEWGEGAGSGPGRTDPGPEGEEPVFSVPVLGCLAVPEVNSKGKIIENSFASLSAPLPSPLLPPSLLFFV